MLLVTIDSIPGKQIEALGMVKGTIVQSKHLGRDFMASLKTLVGGEIVGYTEMLTAPQSLTTRYSKPHSSRRICCNRR